MESDITCSDSWKVENNQEGDKAFPYNNVEDAAALSVSG